MDPKILHDMLHVPIPILEKIVRPILVYLALLLLLRIFGKRELAQLNPFDLVVLLSLSNTVQNAIIGDDNSLTVNWVVARLVYGSTRASQAITGTERILIIDGMVDHRALKKELISHEDLMAVIHRQGFSDFSEIAKCVLEPNGSFYILGRNPSLDDERQKILLDRLEALSNEIQSLRQQLSAQAPS